LKKSKTKKLKLEIIQKKVTLEVKKPEKMQKI
jgi:hypothetical protein